MATTTMNIAMPDTMRAYVIKRVRTGGYGNTSEYIRELIRNDQRGQEIHRLQALISEGLASGPPIPDDPGEWNELLGIAGGHIK